ncbi:MAG: protein translocase subunit SecD, partial [Kordiimonadaceae bacterium]|nr:protein translocase subunit SecD [Kordiimonadaceae bacterium]
MLTFPRWKVVMILGIVFWGVITALPNFLSESQRAALPGFMPSATLSLGLDLQGGVHLLYGAQTEEVVAARLNNIADQVRDLRRSEKGLNFRKIRIEGQSVTFEVTRDEMLPLAEEKLTPLLSSSGGLANPLVGGGIEEMTMGIEGNVFTLTLTEQGIAMQKREAISRAIEVIRKRVDPTGTKEITLQPQGCDRIILEVPGEGDPEAIKRLIGKTAKLSFHDVVTGLSQSDIAKGRLKPRQKLLPLQDGGALVINERVIVSGEDLTDAKAAFDERGRPAVSFTFNTSGARRFGNHTRKNIGRPFAIVLGDVIISAPNIQSAILGGSGIITGAGTVAETQELATLLKAGALPVKLTVLAERTVGPDLGADSIEAGSTAAIIGFIAVIVYMVPSYGKFGLAASVA